MVEGAEKFSCPALQAVKKRFASVIKTASKACDRLTSHAYLTMYSMLMMKLKKISIGILLQAQEGDDMVFSHCLSQALADLYHTEVMKIEVHDLCIAAFASGVVLCTSRSQRSVTHDVAGKGCSASSKTHFWHEGAQC